MPKNQQFTITVKVRYSRFARLRIKLAGFLFRMAGRALPQIRTQIGDAPEVKASPKLNFEYQAYHTGSPFVLSDVLEFKARPEPTILEETAPFTKVPWHYLAGKPFPTRPGMALLQGELHDDDYNQRFLKNDPSTFGPSPARRPMVGTDHIKAPFTPIHIHIDNTSTIGPSPLYQTFKALTETDELKITPPHVDAKYNVECLWCHNKVHLASTYTKNGITPYCGTCYDKLAREQGPLAPTDADEPRWVTCLGCKRNVAPWEAYSHHEKHPYCVTCSHMLTLGDRAVQPAPPAEADETKYVRCQLCDAKTFENKYRKGKDPICFRCARHIDEYHARTGGEAG